MKIGVLSDTHIPLKAQALPAKVKKLLKDVDMIIHAGDLVDESVLEELKLICADVKVVRGNMDVGELRKLLPEKELIKIKNFTIGLMHGYGPPGALLNVVKESFKKDKVDMIIFGHSHCPFNEKKDGVIFFNPGSPTDELFAPFNSIGIIEVDKTIKASIIKL